MKKLVALMIVVVSGILILSGCGGEEEGTIGDDGRQCVSTSDCPLGYVCDLQTGKCIDPSSGDGGLPGEEDNNNGNNQDDGNNDDGNNNQNPDDPYSCNPGEVQKCPYNGDPATENFGPCKAGQRTCKSDGTWGYCEGEVLPVEELGELCHDGIDNDCTGKVDTGVDWDGDGVPACQDCCEFAHECPDPSGAWDETKHFCSFDESENIKMYVCDDQITPGTNDPMQYAKAIGLCHTATDDPSSGWGVISAEILKPDGNFGAHQNSNGLLNALGHTIKPFSGNYLLALTSGRVGNPFPEKHYKQNISSGPPADWYSANGNKLPDAPGCSSGSGDKVNDPVMFKLRIRVPKGVQSFSFDIYFLSIEFPQYVCTAFNDFFVALLDSTHTSSNPEFQNPLDKNLAMDENGYPVGVNLAKSGLFKVCPVSGTYPSCTGTAELGGTGFEQHGATGWLTVRGNVVPDEVITLRLAIWDTGDHVWDSKVLIDNFRWEFEEYKPGTGEK
jgi:hypothetical protein